VLGIVLEFRDVIGAIRCAKKMGLGSAPHSPDVLNGIKSWAHGVLPCQGGRALFMKQKLWFDGGVKNGRLAVGLEDDLAKEPAATVTAHIRGKGAKAYARRCFSHLICQGERSCCR
jgi:hypothetical protein